MATLPEHVGPYRILSELGRGGFGTVYRAQDPQGQACAVKVLHGRSSSDDETRLARVARELEALRRISHRGVVRVLDSGWHRGTLYIVMELVEGESLQAQLGRLGPLLPIEAAELCADLARTLHALHRRGIVHRDVKPDNVLLDQGKPRLADLGLVHLEDEQERLTKSGTTMGTPGFCAPEVLSADPRRGPPGPAVDIYGLGATLYATLSGRAPFVGASVYEVAVQTVEAEPKPPSREGGAPGRRTPRRRNVDASHAARRS